MRKQNATKNPNRETPENTTRTFFEYIDGSGTYQIRFAYKKDMGAGCGFLNREGTLTLQAANKDEAKEIFQSLPATRAIKGLRIMTISRILFGLIWNMEA